MKAQAHLCVDLCGDVLGEAAIAEGGIVRACVSHGSEGAEGVGLRVPTDDALLAPCQRGVERRQERLQWVSE